MPKEKKENKIKQNAYSILERCVKKKDFKEWNKFRNINSREIELEGIDLEDAYLADAWLSNINFKSAGFEDAILDGANLSGSNLSSTILEDAILKNANLGKANLQNSQMYGAILKDADLTGAHLEGADLSQVNLERADLRGIYIGKYQNGDKKLTKFDDALFGDAILSISEDCKTNIKEIIKAFSKAEVNNIRFLDPVFGRKVRDEAWLHHFKRNCQEKWYKRLGLWLWKWTSDYGRRMSRWLLVSFIIAFIFGILFTTTPDWMPVWWKTISNNIGPKLQFDNPSPTIFTPFYYSIVTFTTLGFGDITPINLAGEILVTLEVFLGYLMLGGLISIFANKLARRND